MLIGVWIDMFNRKKKEEEIQKGVPTQDLDVRVTFDLFKVFNEISNLRKDLKIVEISLRQGQFLIIFEPGIIPLNAFEKISKAVRKSDNGLLPIYSSIGFINENPALIINTNNFKSDQFEFSPTFEVLDKVITYAAENICKCPALEIAFSSQYIKCYLDKPGITTEDISKYEEMFLLRGTLELFGQRPYLLLINDDFEE